MSTIALDRYSTRWGSLFTRHAQWRLFKFTLVVGDVLALFVAFVLAYLVRFSSGLPFFEDVQPSPELHRWLIGGLIPLSLLIFSVFQLYNIHYLLGGTQEYARVLNACAVGLSFTIVDLFFFPIARISRGWITLAWLLALVLVGLTRFSLRRLIYQLRRRGLFTSRTLIVGTDDEALAIAHQLQSTPTAGAQIVGFVANQTPVKPKLEGNFSVVGSIDALPALVKSLAIAELIISTASLPREDLLAIFELFGHSDQVELRFSSGLYELFTAGVHVKEIGAVPLVSMNKVRLNGFESFFKTLLDLTLSLMGLFAFLPILAIIALWIKLDSPGPAIYRRRVLGRGGVLFDAYKFRTMYSNGDEILKQQPELVRKLKEDHKLKDDPRVTRVGARLRRLSFDELPQLFNVLRGQMSLVGPRMITAEEVEKYGRLRMNLLTVKPGLTGLWQIKGRSDVSYDERVRLDTYYIRNYSIWLDLQILFQTIPAVLNGKGAY